MAKTYIKIDARTLGESEDITQVNNYLMQDILNRISETEAKITELNAVLSSWNALKIQAENLGISNAVI